MSANPLSFAQQFPQCTRCAQIRAQCGSTKLEIVGQMRTMRQHLHPGQGLKASYRWIIFAVTVFITSIGLMAWAAVFPLLNLWVRDLGISRTQGGVLFALYYVPGMIVALPGGWSFDRFPAKRVFLISWSLLLAGCAVMALAPTFLVLCLGRLLLSIGLNVHHVGAPKLLASWFRGRKE